MDASARDSVVRFCPCCFADEHSGSMSHVVVAGHCTNCGNGSTVELPAWSIASIREQASFVGRRYYPSDEDREAQVERTALLGLVTVFPGRSAKPVDGQPGRWVVTQAMPNGRSVQTALQAADAADAMRRCGLRYTPDSSAA